MFNIFINDIFDFVKKGDLHNYADDNTLSYGSNSVDDVIETLEEQRSFIKILNITGPRMDHWGTPLYISRKELQTDPILIHCFLPVR
jgi:hypothetical protein